MNYRICSKISYLLNARHRRGHGIHSPFLFRLITQVIENKGNFSAYPILASAELNERKMLHNSRVQPSRKQSANKNESVARLIPQTPMLSPRFNKLLFRLVNDFGPGRISFYGATSGVTLLALALADSRIRLAAQLVNSHDRSLCRRLAEMYQAANIDVTGPGAMVSSDFAVVQDPQDPDHCNRMLAQIVDQPDFDGVAVLCGIHASKEMEAVWERYKELQQVRIALDLFELGILVCRKGLQKENFVVRF